MLKRVKFRYTLFIFIVIFQSCSWLNKNEGVPAYLDIENINFSYSGNDSSISHHIVDVWIGTQADELGVYNLPATIPVLEYGEQIITIEGGIYIDGQTSTRNKYFFYKTFLDTLNLIESQKYSITPKYEYIDDAVFSPEGSDNFESSFKKVVSESGQIIDYKSDDESFEGTSAFLYNKDGISKKLRIQSKYPFLVNNDKANAPVFLEFDYKTTLETNVGVNISTDDNSVDVPHVTIFKTDGEWKHFYVDLTQEVNLSSPETYYKLFFEGDSSVQNDYIALDNMRLIYKE